MSRTLETPTGPLPISKPHKSETPQWRELVVSTQLPPSDIVMTNPLNYAEAPPEFQLSVAKASTPPSIFLPTLSERYKALESSPGSVIEISPESHSYVADFARRIGGSSSNHPEGRDMGPKIQSRAPPPQNSRPSGAALIIDYGTSATVPTSTLRGIRAHQLVSPFTSPGLVDISADVDFTALAESALNASPGIEVHGPVEQASWLESMGIRERGEILCKQLIRDENEEARKTIRTAIERLVERGGGAMGKVYKMLAIVPERSGKRPEGFGSSVA